MEMERLHYIMHRFLVIIIVENVIIFEKMHNTTNENEFNWNPGHSDVVQYLIKKGANIEAQNRRKLTALHYSALSGNEQNQMTKITYINIEIKLELSWNLQNWIKLEFREVRCYQMSSWQRSWNWG